MNSTIPASTTGSDPNITLYIMLSVAIITSTLNCLHNFAKTIKKSKCMGGEVEFRSSESIKRMEDGTRNQQ